MARYTHERNFEVSLGVEPGGVWLVLFFGGVGLLSGIIALVLLAYMLADAIGLA